MPFPLTLLFPLATLAKAATQSPFLPTDDCPVLGPNFPSDFNLTESEYFKQAVQSIPGRIDELFESGLVLKNSSSFHIDVFSTQTNASIYSYSHSADLLKPALTSGILDDGTIFRIGSISKLYTVCAILNVAGIDIFQHPVTKYIPELAGNTARNQIIWEAVTVGALSYHQAGTGGFPLDIVGCLEPGKGPCDVGRFLSIMKDIQIPSIPVFQTTLYSDAAFGVLGRVLERLTNQSFEDALQTHLTAPLGLKSTMGKEPPKEGLNALAVPGNSSVSSWGQDNHVTVSSGGIYSNARDLRVMGLSILQNSVLCADTVREWMKPRGHTASLTTSVGAPWEIYRLAIPVSPSSNRTRISDLYTKTGGNAGYSAVFALSPDHGIGYSILIAGEGWATDRTYIRDAITGPFVIAAEAAAFANAQNIYPGTFVDPQSPLSNLTLTVDEDKPGVGLSSLFINGTESKNLLSGSYSTEDILSFRFYPAGIEYTSPNAPGFLFKQFNVVASPKKAQPRAQVEGGEGLIDNGCIAWEDVGFWNTTEFAFGFSGGKLMTITGIAANITLIRVD